MRFRVALLTAALLAACNGSPPPAAPTATASPVAGPTTAAPASPGLAVTGGTHGITITPAGANLGGSTFSEVAVSGSSSTYIDQAILAYTNAASELRIVNLNLPEAPQAGKTYDLAGPPLATGGKAGVAFTDAGGSIPKGKARQWSSTAGTLAVTGVEGKKVTLVVDAQLGPSDIGSDKAEGTVAIKGTVVVDAWATN